ncbi:SDR family NAD(P)-dependent oxidoreductase [Neptunicoccus cionae]|uniref:SDR family NAD(P)-dependent oxidoreductase n=1 Tax=Neptunicoccus cionae TaxID=2035344 RepID=UPI000C764D5F|nr:SDR family NAD(P)-dependent oxidoreductase [Amylibacter cionae]PLS20163.1 hypothetical protein C0U40_18030 [Amylibacter cionae]
MKQDTSTKKTAVLTASYSGLGFELSRLLLADDYRLICVDRNTTKSTNARQVLLSEYPSVEIVSVTADMASSASITQAAQRILEQVANIDVLFHVAGAATAKPEFSSAGNEMHFQVNTLGPIALTHALRPALSSGDSNAVVVVVGSSAMKMARTLNVETLINPPKFKKMSGPYAQSKLAITTALAALSDDYKAEGILLRVVDPGPSRTAMSKSDAMPWIVRRIRRWFPLPIVGARKIFSAGVSEKFGSETGIYIERDKIVKLPAPATNQTTQKLLMRLIAECEQSSAEKAP